MHKLLLSLMALLAVGITTGVAYAEISVTQEDLTPEEQKVLDDIAAARADGTYIPLPEAPLTADVRVYSEEISIQVTHPVDLEAVHCYVNFDLFVATTHCILPGFPPHPEDQYFDTDTQDWRPVEELILAAEEEQEKINLESMTREERYNEERINYLEQKRKLSNTDAEELRLRTQIDALCRNDTLVSQKYREFQVETEIYRDHEGNFREQLKVDQNPMTNDVRDSRYVQGLKNQVQECIAQPYTKKSVQYDHIVVDGLFDADPNKPVLPEAISASMVNKESNTSKVTDLKKLACDSYTTMQTRDLYGCPKLTPDPQTIEPTNEVTDYTQTSSYQKWLDYLEDPNSQLQEIRDKQTREYYQSHNLGGQYK